MSVCCGMNEGLCSRGNSSMFYYVLSYPLAVALFPVSPYLPSTTHIHHICHQTLSLEQDYGMGENLGKWGSKLS